MSICEVIQECILLSTYVPFWHKRVDNTNVYVEKYFRARAEHYYYNRIQDPQEGMS